LFYFIFFSLQYLVWSCDKPSLFFVVNITSVFCCILKRVIWDSDVCVDFMMTADLNLRLCSVFFVVVMTIWTCLAGISVPTRL